MMSMAFSLPPSEMTRSVGVADASAQFQTETFVMDLSIHVTPSEA